MNIYHLMAAHTLLLFLSGCMVGPTYRRPCVKIPEHYQEEPINNNPADLHNWWTFFEDPHLTKLIEKALANNYNLRGAIEKIEEIRSLYGIAQANLFPEIDLTAAANRINVSASLSENDFIPFKEFSYFQLGLQTIWELDFWGKLRRARNAAYDEYQAQIESMRDVYIILLSDVARIYIDCRALQKKIAITEQQITLDTKLVLLAHDRLKSGLASEIPDLEQNILLEESTNQLLLMQQMLGQTINQLAVLLGQNPEDFILPKENQGVPIFKKNISVGLPSDLLRARPDIRRAERLLAAATENVGQAIAQWFPSFSLIAGGSYEANKTSFLFKNKSLSWIMGPSVTWPIITFGRIQCNIDAKRSIERQALLEYSQTIIQALADVENSLIAYLSITKRKDVIEKKLMAAKKESLLAQSLFECGLASESDFLISEKNRLAIESELIDLQQAFSASIIALYKALGGGW